MASGRVGGTRSKIRGQVGGTIYQVVKNPDGTYTQISYGKPEDVTKTITPRLQAQRMCTSIVEALMRDLRPIGNISMQSGANKSKSLNAFSSFNLQLVARDCKANWYSGNNFYYPSTSLIGETDEQIGGEFLLSSGTCQENGFDEVLHIVNPQNVWPYVSFIGKRFAGLRFSLSASPESVDQFLTRHHLTPLDSVCFACFHTWQDTDPENDDPASYTKHSYIIANIDATINRRSEITPEIIKKLFVCSSDMEVFQDVSPDGKNFYIGYLIDNAHDNAYFLTMGAFTISYATGKKHVTTSYLRGVDDRYQGYCFNYAPADVFGSWMGEPSVKPYPSPF